MPKIDGAFKGFNISAKGLKIQRKKMNLIAENIANADTVRNGDGTPFKRKMLNVQIIDSAAGKDVTSSSPRISLQSSDMGHFSMPLNNKGETYESDQAVNFDVLEDPKKGEVVYMPDHPDADDNGYVEMSNVNIINEMVDMIAATRSYEANLTALNATKENIKDSLEI